jgi:hypothetical protein
MSEDANGLNRAVGHVEGQLELLTKLMQTLSEKVDGMQRRIHIMIGGFAVISWIFSKVDPIALISGIAKAGQ